MSTLGIHEKIFPSKETLPKKKRKETLPKEMDH